MTREAALDSTYNDYFASEAEARLARALWHLALYGLERPIGPFPGDRPKGTKAINTTGRRLFETLRQVDMSEYASRFTRLTPAGPEKWKGLCPPHQERTPSFYVYADPWRWCCYGVCAMGGDIVDLVSELKVRGRRP